MPMTSTPTRRRISTSGIRDWRRAPVYSPGQAVDAQRDGIIKVRGHRARRMERLPAFALIGGWACVTGLHSGLSGETAVASCLLVVPGGRQAGPPPVDLNQARLQ
jgi:hypothetical protein